MFQMYKKWSRELLGSKSLNWLISWKIKLSFIKSLNLQPDRYQKTWTIWWYTTISLNSLIKRWIKFVKFHLRKILKSHIFLASVFVRKKKRNRKYGWIFKNTALSFNKLKCNPKTMELTVLPTWPTLWQGLWTRINLTNGNLRSKHVLLNNKLDFDEKFGSGGTSDPFTIKWLQENKHHMFGFPDIVRFSWATIPKCLDGVLVMEVKEDYEASKMLKSHNIISRNQK